MGTMTQAMKNQIAENDGYKSAVKKKDAIAVLKMLNTTCITHQSTHK
jgi:hypothetical protein